MGKVNDMIDDGIKIEKLSDYKKVKPFLLKLGKEKDGVNIIDSFFNISNNKIKFSELIKKENNAIKQKTISIVLENQKEMAILQLVLGVRRNKFNSDLLVKGSNAKLRMKNIINNSNIISNYLSNILSEEDEIKIAKQPIYMEYK